MKVESAELARRLAAFEAACRQAGVKLTHQRLEIFREVAASADHPDAERVFQKVRKRMPTVSLDTVYRTLSLLGELGMVTPLGPRRESVRFDANLSRHHHYVCVSCGLTRDFESPALDELRLPEAVKALGSIDATQVEVRGRCAACATHQAGPAVNRKRPAAPPLEKREPGAGDTGAPPSAGRPAAASGEDQHPPTGRRARWTRRRS